MKPFILILIFSSFCISLLAQNQLTNADEKVSPSKRKMRISEGFNQIAVFNNQYKAGVNAKIGQPLEWVIVDPSGNEVPSVVYKEQTVCWRCFVEEGGRKHCIEIPCPKDLKPWGGGKRKTSLF